MIKVEKCLLIWENFEETDGNKLRRFLKDNFDISWVEKAIIHKPTDKKIIFSTDEESGEIILDKDNIKATLKIANKQTYDLLVVKENNKFNILNSKVSQGDIYKNIEFIEYVKEENGIIEVSKIVFPYAIILTQECDLTHDFTFRFNKQKNGDKILLSVLAAPIYNAEHVSNGEHLSQIRKRPMQEIKMKRKGSFTTSWNKLIQNETPRYHYLEFPNEVPFMVPSVIDFKHYFSLNVEYLYEIRQENFLCKVSELYREDISHRFASFLSRIGLP